MKYTESRISGYHNYLINGVLMPGFVLGDRGTDKGPYVLAEPIPVGGQPPLISARVLDEQGRVRFEMHQNRMAHNPAGCTLERLSGGFRVLTPSGEAVLEVHTEVLANGFLTRLSTTVCDVDGKRVPEPFAEGSRAVEFAMLLHPQTVNRSSES